MSHNKIKVGGASQDANGNLNVSLDNLSDVTITSPSVNQMLKYNGSGFVNGSKIFESDLKFGFVCDTRNWGSGSYSYIENDYLTVRYFGGILVKDTGYNVNNATNANAPATSTRWFESIDIPTAGKYLFIVTVGTRSGKGVWQCSNNAGVFGAKCYNEVNPYNGSVICAIADCVANDVFRVVLVEEETNIRLQYESTMRAITFQIYKIG